MIWADWREARCVPWRYALRLIRNNRPSPLCGESCAVPALAPFPGSPQRLSRFVVPTNSLPVNAATPFRTRSPLLSHSKGLIHMHAIASTSISSNNELQQAASRQERQAGSSGDMPLMHAVAPDGSGAGWRKAAAGWVDAPARSASPVTFQPQSAPADVASNSGCGAALAVDSTTIRPEIHRSSSAGYDSALTVATSEGSNAAALLAAAQGGNVGMVQALVEAIGMPVPGSAMKFLPTGDRALAVAAGHGHLDVVRCLLATVELLNSTTFRYPAFAKAVAAGHAGVAAHLMECEKLESVRLQAVFDAVASGHDGVLQALIDIGCPVNAIVVGGRSPLEAAVSQGNLAATRLLLDAGSVISDKLLRRVQSVLQQADANPSMAAAAQAVDAAWRSRAARDAADQ